MWLVVAATSAWGASDAMSELALGHRERARFLATARVRGEPEAADAWIELARATEPSEAATYLQEALRLEPGNPAATVALAEALAGQGRAEEAVALLTPLAQPDRSIATRLPALIALTDTTRDPGPALQALEVAPGHPDAARAVARWSDDPGVAARVLGTVEAVDRRVLAARITARLRVGELDAARADLLALRELDPHGADTERLGRWVDCVDEGTVDLTALGALWDGGRRSLVERSDGGLEQVAASSQCPALLALRAAADPGASWALEAALALEPDDSGLQSALGVSRLRAGRAAEAVPLLRAAAAARPFEAPTDLGRALALAGDPDAARALLAEAAPRYPADAALALARADLAPDPGSELELLLQALRTLADPALLARARQLALDLDRQDSVEEVAWSQRVPATGGADYEELVLARGSNERLRELELIMTELGYGEAIRRANGDVHFATKGVDRPALTLHPDGEFELQRSGFTPTSGPNGSAFNMVSDRKLAPYRDRLMERITPTLLAWRAAIRTESVHE